MSADELILEDAPIKFKLKEADSIKGYIKVEIYLGLDEPRAIAVFDRNQISLLKIWLQER